MKIWRHGYIWFGTLLVCLVLLSVSSTMDVAPTMKSLPMGAPWAVVPVPQPTNWYDIALKIGSGLGGLMTLVNLIEKFVKMFRGKPTV